MAAKIAKMTGSSGAAELAKGAAVMAQISVCALVHRRNNIMVWCTTSTMDLAMIICIHPTSPNGGMMCDGR